MILRHFGSVPTLPAYLRFLFHRWRSSNMQHMSHPFQQPPENRKYTGIRIHHTSYQCDLRNSVKRGLCTALVHLILLHSSYQVISYLNFYKYNISPRPHRYEIYQEIQTWILYLDKYLSKLDTQPHSRCSSVRREALVPLQSSRWCRWRSLPGLSHFPTASPR